MFPREVHTYILSSDTFPLNALSYIHFKFKQNKLL